MPRLPQFRRRAVLIAAFFAVAVAATGYTMWWYRLAATLRQGLDQWTAAQTAIGWQVVTGNAKVDGFPFDLRLELPSPSVADPRGDHWDGPPVVVRLSPLRPDRPQLTASGRHAFVLAGRSPIVVSAGAAIADLVVDGNGLGAADLHLADVTLGSAGVDRVEATLRRLAAEAADHTTPTLAITLAIDRLTLSSLPLGRVVTQARVEARVLGKLDPGKSKAGLAAWRDDGGTIELDRLSVDWPPLALDGSGTLALDQELQPILASSCTIRGLFDAIDALVQAGMLRPKDGAITKLGLGLLSKPRADGVPQWVAPVTVQNQRLSVGPFAILKVPLVQW